MWERNLPLMANNTFLNNVGRNYANDVGTLPN